MEVWKDTLARQTQKALEPGLKLGIRVEFVTTLYDVNTYQEAIFGGEGIISEVGIGFLVTVDKYYPKKYEQEPIKINLIGSKLIFFKHDYSNSKGNTCNWNNHIIDILEQ